LYSMKMFCNGGLEYRTTAGDPRFFSSWRYSMGSH
jgi:hypothetical protein